MITRGHRSIPFFRMRIGWHGLGVLDKALLIKQSHVDMGTAYAIDQDQTLMNLPRQRIQSDEIWLFVGSKEKNIPEGKEGQYDDVWAWTAIDVDTKVVSPCLVDGCDSDYADEFIMDVAKRLTSCDQLTSGGHKPFLMAVEGAFGWDVDFAVLEKPYGRGPEQPNTRHSPAVYTGGEKKIGKCDPNPAHISNSYVERPNLMMRMKTRLTSASSNKIENHAHAITSRQLRK